MNTTFSIIIPLFNKKDYIDRAIKSVLNQTHSRFELIIVDDGSSDGGENVIHDYKDTRVRIVHQNNMGVSIARNNGVANSKCDYICFLDADDEWKPNFLYEMSSMVDDYPNHNIFSLRHEVLSIDGVITYPRTGLKSGFRGPVVNFSKLYATSNGLINSSSVCLRKEHFFELGGFPENKNFGEDIYLWLRSDINNDIVFNDLIGSTYYKNTKNNSINRINNNDIPYYIEFYFKAINNAELINKNKRRDILFYLRRQSMLHTAGLVSFGKSEVALTQSKKIIKYNLVTGLACILIAISPEKLVRTAGLIRSFSKRKI